MRRDLRTARGSLRPLLLLALLGTAGLAQDERSPTTSCTLPRAEEGLARPYCRPLRGPEPDAVVALGPRLRLEAPSLPLVGKVTPTSGTALTAPPDLLADLFAQGLRAGFPLPLHAVPAGAADALPWRLLDPAGTPVATLEGARIEQEREVRHLVLVGSRSDGDPLMVLLPLMRDPDGGLFVPPVAGERPQSGGGGARAPGWP